MEDDRRQRLVALYAALAAHTEPECFGVCARPLSCCAERYCLDAIEFARESWDTELERTWHPVLPLMGSDGCTAAPHLRPLCTGHTCEISQFGCKRGDRIWTERYFELQDEIAAIETELARHRGA